MIYPANLDRTAKQGFQPDVEDAWCHANEDAVLVLMGKVAIDKDEIIVPQRTGILDKNP